MNIAINPELTSATDINLAIFVPSRRAILVRVHDVDSDDLFGCGETHAGIVLKLAVPLHYHPQLCRLPLLQACDFRVVYTGSRSFVAEEEGTVVA